MEDEVDLVSANSSHIESKGVVNVELSIQGLVIPCTLYVLKSLSHNMILGNDFLRMSGAVIDCARRSIAMFEGLVVTSLTTQKDGDSLLCLVKYVTIPPATEAIVNLFVHPRYRHKTSLLETYEPIKNQFLMVAGALIRPTSQYSICRIVNTGLVSRTLKARTPIASINSINMSHQNDEALLTIDVQNSPTTTSLSRDVKSIPREERVKVLKAIGLDLNNPNLSPEEQSQLSKLLYEYQDIFCSDYDKLPTSNLPPYHINLKDNKPIRQKRYPLPPAQERILERFADKRLAAKIVEESNLPWNAPAILVRKTNFDPNRADDLSSWRLCVDFRKHNKVIESEFQPLTDCQTVFTQIAEVKPKYF